MENAERPAGAAAEIARRAELEEKLDAACARLEAEATVEAEAERLEYDHPPKPPDEAPPPNR